MGKLEQSLERHRAAREKLIDSLPEGWLSSNRPSDEILNTGVMEYRSGDLEDSRRLPEKLNVVFLNYMLAGLGGIESWAAALANELAKEPRIRVVGFGAETETQGPCNLAVRNACPVAIGRKEMAAMAASADVVIASGLIDWAAMKLHPRQRVIWVSHGNCQWTRSAAQAALPYAHQYVAVHEAAKDSIPASRQDSAVVISNAVDSRRLVSMAPRDELRRNFGWESPILLYLGRFSNEKRPTIALEAISRLDDWNLVMAGDGPLRKSLTDLTSKLGIRDRVLMLGSRGDVGDLIRAADVLILPSASEGFALAAAEAMWHGLPVVASQVGIFTDRPDLAVVLPAHGTEAEEWAAAVRKAAIDSETARKAKEYARAEFDPAAWGQAWADLTIAIRPPTEITPMPRTDLPPTSGPGTELAKLIGGLNRLMGPLRAVLGVAAPALRESLDLKSTVGCGCMTRMRKMDEWGVKGCTEHLATIVGWLKESAESKGLHAPDSVVRLLVNRAIKRASRKSG